MVNNNEGAVYQTRLPAVVLNFAGGRGEKAAAFAPAMMPRLCILLALLLAVAPARAAELRIAVASNFAATLGELARTFEEQTGHRLRLSPGSTGKHYAQIRHGAPFDLFFAADARRPRLLEDSGVAVKGSRFTYAQGRLVLWSPRADALKPDHAAIPDRLASGDFRRLAIANPKLAPYGRAAREVLQAQGLWSRLRPRLVRGENVGQTIQFVSTGNAELGFVALSQVIPARGQPARGAYWEVPRALYTPILQQAVLIRDSDAAREFLRFVRSAQARALIRAHGYRVR